MSADLLEHTVKYGVDYAPSRMFFAGKQDSHYIRVAFSMLTKAQIREGIRRMGTAIREWRGIGGK